jgi:uncharacterized membrane protein
MKKIVFILLVIVMGLIVLTLRTASTSIQSNDIWTRLKRRVLDQDMPMRQKEAPPQTDLSDVGTPSPSLGLSPQ